MEGLSKVNDQVLSDCGLFHRVDVAANPKALRSSSNLHRLVFVIDDDDSCRSAICRLLSSIGFASVEFASAEAFLNFNRESDEGHAECAIVDHHMTGMSGLELQAELTRRSDAIPMIFMSGVAEFATAAEAMRNGAVQLLEKPVRAASLKSALENAFSRQALSAVASRPKYDMMNRVKLVHRLSPREYEVAQMVTQGHSTKQIASKLQLSEKTIEKYRSNIVKKLGVRSSTEMVRMVVTAELLGID